MNIFPDNKIITAPVNIDNPVWGVPFIFIWHYPLINLPTEESSNRFCRGYGEVVSGWVSTP